ncbi:MAG: GNAT family protein [Melioribacteraceae bacterium]|jgi:RimJ/RimL family protein N-acetyltransferase|nr:GNAT family protein [Melioribacteraceae bacterium]
MIKGKLVGLRAVEREDLVLLRDWRNNPDFRKNFREVRELNMANQENWYNKSCVNNPNDFMFIIERLSDNKPIGACGLLYINWVIRSGDFSFYIGENNSYIDDEGYAEDAARLLINYGFNTLNLHKIWMELYEFDTKKIKFFTNDFNFKQDGLLRDNCFEDGKYCNSLILSLINE